MVSLTTKRLSLSCLLLHNWGQLAPIPACPPALSCTGLLHHVFYVALRCLSCCRVNLRKGQHRTSLRQAFLNVDGLQRNSHTIAPLDHSGEGLRYTLSMFDLPRPCIRWYWQNSYGDTADCHDCGTSNARHLTYCNKALSWHWTSGWQWLTFWSCSLYAMSQVCQWLCSSHRITMRFITAHLLLG